MSQSHKMIKVNWHDEGLEGNNNGYIYGIYFLTDDIANQEVDDVMWYKTEEERDNQYEEEEDGFERDMFHGRNE